HASAGIKILAPDLEDSVAGAPLYVIEDDSKEEEIYKKVEDEVNSIRIQTDKAGIVLKTDTLGSLEALGKHLSENGIDISRADVGPIKKADILSAVVVRDFDLYSSVVLGFNVNILDEAKEMAYNENVRIFTNDVIYRLTEDYIEYKETRKAEDTAKELGELILPGKLQMMPEFIFRNSNPAVFGVRVIGGDLISKVPIIKNNGKYIGRINKVQDKGQNIQKATKDMEVAVSMKGVEIGRDLEKDEILYINVPESHVRQLIGKFLDELTSEQKDILREYIVLMRKEKNPWWGM
ncbi:MAG: translation initiation factor IF-2, partial [Candidatus Lokiarchaeota archaeon]|nr:translation initiation factor IF-2 [Candidatus Lokiarchaeota archaeon]